MKLNRLATGFRLRNLLPTKNLRVIPSVAYLAGAEPQGVVMADLDGHSRVWLKPHLSRVRASGSGDTRKGSVFLDFSCGGNREGISCFSLIGQAPERTALAEPVARGSAYMGLAWEGWLRRVGSLISSRNSRYAARSQFPETGGTATAPDALPTAHAQQVTDSHFVRTRRRKK